MRHHCQLLLVCLGLIACAGGPRPVFTPRVEAIASDERMVLSFPAIPPDSLPWPIRSNGAQFSWTLWAGSSIVRVGPMPEDTARSFKNLEQVIHSSVVRRCQSPSGHVLLCLQSLKASIRLEHGVVVATIADTGFVRFLLRNCADSAWLITHA